MTKSKIKFPLFFSSRIIHNIRTAGSISFTPSFRSIFSKHLHSPHKNKGNPTKLMVKFVHIPFETKKFDHSFIFRYTLYFSFTLVNWRKFAEMATLLLLLLLLLFLLYAHIHITHTNVKSKCGWFYILYPETKIQLSQWICITDSFHQVWFSIWIYVI